MKLLYGFKICQYISKFFIKTDSNYWCSLDFLIRFTITG